MFIYIRRCNFDINENDIEIIIENIHDLRENILYMLSFEKIVRDEQIVRPMSVDDEE